MTKTEADKLCYLGRLPENPSKAQELNHWESFLATLPKESYLASYLDGATDILRYAMLNDMSIELVKETRKQTEYARQEYREAAAKGTEAQAELVKVQTQLRYARQALAAVQEEVKEVAQAAANMSRHCTSILEDYARNLAARPQGR